MACYLLLLLCSREFNWLKWGCRSSGETTCEQQQQQQQQQR
jgi:hypothetical protein